MSEYDDFQKVCGRQFTATSGNVGVASMLGVRGLYVKWDRQDSEADRREFETWLIAELDGGYQVGLSMSSNGRPEALKQYEDWRRSEEKIS